MVSLPVSTVEKHFFFCHHGSVLTRRQHRYCRNSTSIMLKSLNLCSQTHEFSETACSIMDGYVNGRDLFLNFCHNMPHPLTLLYR